MTSPYAQSLKLNPTPDIVGPHSVFTPDLIKLANAAAATAVYPAANFAIFVPMLLDDDYVAQQIWWLNGTIVSAPSIDAGIYTEKGALLYHTGAVTQVNSSTIQATGIAGGLSLPRGRYWLGIVVGNNTTGLYSWHAIAALTNITKMLGMSEQALGSVALPSQITFGPSTSNFVPVMGLSMQSVPL